MISLSCRQTSKISQGMHASQEVLLLRAPGAGCINYKGTFSRECLFYRLDDDLRIIRTGRRFYGLVKNADSVDKMKV